MDRAKAADAAHGSLVTRPTMCGLPDRASRTCSAPKGVPSQAASRILEGFRPPNTNRPCLRQPASTRVRSCWASSTWMNSPWARRTRQARPMAMRSTPGAWADSDDRPIDPGRVLGRVGLCRGGGFVPRRDRHRHRRLDPPACRLHGHHRHQAHLWALLALGDRGLCLIARSGRTDDQIRA